MTDDEPIWPSWDGGGSDCETCGYNYNEAEFYIDEDGFNCHLHVGCYSGESFDTNTWAEVEGWLERWDHLKGWSRFARAVREHKPA